MIIKLLGILDIFIGICFWLFGIFNIIPSHFILTLGMILLVKGIIFIAGLSITSFLDIISAGIIIAPISLTMPNLVFIITSLFLLQKGIFSMFS